MAKRKPKAPRAAARSAGPPQSAAANDLQGVLNRAVAAHQSGDLDTAEAGYRDVLDRAPENPYALHFMGVIALQRGDNERSVELIERAVSALPQFADAWSNLGAAYHALKRVNEAEAAFRKAGELNPRLSDAHSNLAAILKDRGSLRDAVASYRKAHEAAPGEPKFLKRLGDCLLELEDFEDAAEWFGKYLERVPDNAEVSNNLAYALERMGEYAKAAEGYEKARQLNPDSPEILNNLGAVLRHLGRYEEAATCLEKSLALDPARWEDATNLARTYANRRDMDRALPLFQKLTEQQPDNAELMNDYGYALSMDGRYEEAEQAYLRAIEIKPDFANAHNNLGSCQTIQNRRPEAIENFKKAIALDPSYLDPHFNICMAMVHESRFEEAYIYARAAVQNDDFTPSKFPNPNKIFRRLCDFDAIDELGNPWENVEDIKAGDVLVTFLEMLIVADTEETVDALARLHRRWGDDVMERAAVAPLPATTLPPPSERGKIRLGIMSSDLRKHSVSKFVLPLLENYDRDRFEIVCYSPLEDREDPVQQKVTSLVADFRYVHGMTDRKVAEEIRADGIDILFELNGFTRDSRVKALSYKPAPVQISWLGYPFSSGLAAIDYIMSDPYLKPLNPDWMAEELLVMPEACWCFGGFVPEPISDRPPVERNGFVTFGSQNNPYKLNRRTIALWSEIMKRVPGSRFLYVRPEADSPILCSNLIKAFGANGIGPERLYFLNNRRTGLSNLAYYDEMDITLDTFPLTGGTTTCEVVWMGLPVVSRVGPSMHQRLSHTVLCNVGLQELSVETDEAYLETAVALASEPDDLVFLRQNLRAELERSALCRAGDYAGHFSEVMQGLVKKHGLR